MAKISVIIPAYNAEKSIETTINSVLNQTLPADEILVMDDGSTDQTAKLVKKFSPKVTLLQQNNQGVSATRNTLFKKASGTLIAMLDSDDIWYSDYLKIQSNLFEKYPDAIASFTRFHNFSQFSSLNFEELTSAVVDENNSKLLNPLDFVKSYYTSTGKYAPSFCVIKKELLSKLGENPMPVNLKAGEDYYFYHTIALVGPVATANLRLGGYSIHENSLSDNKLSVYEAHEKAANMLVKYYKDHNAAIQFQKHAFMILNGSKRKYAKHLFGANETSNARKVLLNALKIEFSIKTLSILLLSFLPKSLQPKWPTPYRKFDKY